MGTFRSNYSLIPEANATRSGTHFSWFHPGIFISTTRNVMNIPFQGTLNNPGGMNDVPIRCMPINETTYNPPVNNEPPIDDKAPAQDEAEPSRPKKPKTSKNTANDGNPSEQKPKKKGRPAKAKNGDSTSVKGDKRNLNLRKYDPSMDAYGNPAPVCSCTGVARQCYRWGAGGWQSACCTTNISEYPLPMSTTRPGARTAGRKMSHGAYDKLVQRLAAQGFDLALPIDLKDHWAKHGTNKFVTIK